MNAVTEAEVTTDVAVDVEAVRIRKATLVPIARPVEQQHDRALGDLGPVVLDIAGDVTRLDG